jgi:hypothetical protein
VGPIAHACLRIGRGSPRGRGGPRAARRRRRGFRTWRACTPVTPRHRLPPRSGRRARPWLKATAALRAGRVSADRDQHHRLTSMRDKSRDRHSHNQSTAGYKRRIRTFDERYPKPLLYPSELACGGSCLVQLRYAHSQRETRQPEFTNPDRCKCSRQRPPDGVPPARNTESVAPRRVFSWGLKCRGPGQRRLTGASCESLAESCLIAALRCIRELVRSVIRFAAERARDDAGAIRRNRDLRQRGGRLACGDVLVVRMHRGAHSREENGAVKRRSSAQKSHATSTLKLSLKSLVVYEPPSEKRGEKNFRTRPVTDSAPSAYPRPALKVSSK